jgi:HD superfamily phosphodiesterase
MNSMTEHIQQIEEYVRSLMIGEIAHDFKHVDRVRAWASYIAQQEQYPHGDLVEAAALLHDIGLVSGERKRHAEVGAEQAASFLRERQLFTAAEIDEIAHAIRLHTTLGSKMALPAILQDADVLDMLGAVGIMRAFTSKSKQPEYPPQLIKGETWGLNADQFTERFLAGIGVGDYIVDQINFQISCWENLHTETARGLAEPLVAFMKVYLAQLETEIGAKQRRIV